MASIRAHGPTAVDKLILARPHHVVKDGGQFLLWNYAVDRVAGQKYASKSKLYWYTSLTAARRASRRTGLPILSLRLLGRLDEDRSCANSRFFRAVLYRDEKISRTLRDRFVLHWQSVRDVPIATIDFGNDVTLTQPIVGNSVHLVLDQHGRPFDAMPGLVSPVVFRAWLADVNQIWADSGQIGDWPLVRAYHRDRAARRRAESTMAIRKDQQVSELNPLDPDWFQLAQLRMLTVRTNGKWQADQQGPPLAERAMLTAPSKSVVEKPVFRMVSSFEQNMSRDTVFNLYALQTKLDDYFAVLNEPPEYQPLTETIYSDIFLMPLKDPWLGFLQEIGLRRWNRSKAMNRLSIIIFHDGCQRWNARSLDN